MSSKPKIIVLAVCAAVVVFLLSPYRNELPKVAPYLLILLCPLMHIFMMRHHGGHNSKCDEKDKKEEQDKKQ